MLRGKRSRSQCQSPKFMGMAYQIDSKKVQHFAPIMTKEKGKYLDLFVYDKYGTLISSPPQHKTPILLRYINDAKLKKGKGIHYKY